MTDKDSISGYQNKVDIHRDEEIEANLHWEPVEEDPMLQNEVKIARFREIGKVLWKLIKVIGMGLLLVGLWIIDYTLNGFGG